MGIKIDIFTKAVGEVQGVFIKGITQVVANLILEGEFSFFHQLLYGVVAAKHLGHRGQIIHRVVVGWHRIFDLPAIRFIGIEVSPGLGIDELAMTKDGELRTGEAMVDIALNQIGNQVQSCHVETFL